MTTRRYSSADASAPTLTGQAGSLTDLLYACLVTGYGARTAAGWARSYYDATSKTAVFRPGAGPQHYFQVADNGPGAGGAKEARIRGYVTMSAYNTGTEPFPTAAQATNALCIRKSTTADATARSWNLIADEKTAYLLIDAADSSNGPLLYFFGAFNSWKSADSYASYVGAKLVENSSTVSTANTPQIYSDGPANANAVAYAPRSYTGSGTAVTLTQRANHALSQQSNQLIIGSVGQTWPNPADGAMLLSPLWLGEGLNIRGTHRGLWQPCHAKPIVQGDTFSAADGATTRDFVAMNLYTTGQVFIETSNTWDTP